MTLIDLHPEDSREEARLMVDAMLRKERDSCPLALLKKDGNSLPVETRVWPGQWHGKSCLFGISKDLSVEQERLQVFSRLFEENPAPMALSGVKDGRFFNINAAFIEKTGYQRAEVLGKTSNELDIFVHPAQRNHAVHLMNEQGWIRNVEIQVKKKNGLIMSGLFSGGILSNQGKPFFLTVMVDITEQVELREHIESQRRKLRHIIDGTRLGTWEWNIRTGEIDINDRWAEMLGYTVEELKPTTIDTWQRLTFPDDLASSEKLLADHFSGTVEFYDSESRMRHKDGSEVWIHDRGKVTDRAADGSPLVMFGTHQDITMHKVMEERIRDMSIHDELTGIYNRRYILERLESLVEQYARNGQSFSVTMLDIDDFKKINDNYGHAAGDMVLRDFAKIATSKIRTYDLIGRIGGEEFLLVSIDTSADKTATSIERIMVEARCRAYVHEGIAYRFTFSAGLADSNEFPRSGTSAASLLALADRRLYMAKAAGKDRLVGPEQSGH
jgi:diguanylate cyclase (GGDEF)-like protein/PAS domain S-box-containing protein